MSGTDLLLRTAIDYERTHQIALFTLLSQSKLPSILVDIPSPTSIITEPEGQLFDLLVEDRTKSTYIELKMWSSLSDNQLKRQVHFLKEKNFRGLYILLGTSWFERTGKSIDDCSHGAARRIGYEELIASLNNLMVAAGQQPEAYELALAYRNALQDQYDRIKNAYKSKSDLKLYYYSIYHEIQMRLKGMDTSIYTVNNPGGPVYILNNSDYWLEFVADKVAGKLYYELVNGRLRIKFHVKASDDIKRQMRDRVREAIKKVYAIDYQIIDSGKLGAYMTACEIDYDFNDIEKFDRSAQIFQDIAARFDKVVKAIS